MTVIFENLTNNQILNLSANENIYQVKNITGIDAADRTILTDKTTLQHGGIYSGWVVNDREINIEVKINGNREANRRALVSFLRSGERYRLFLTSTYQYYIDVYISDLNYEIYTNSQSAIITLIAPYPYFVQAYQPTNPDSFRYNTLEYIYNYCKTHTQDAQTPFPFLPDGFIFPDNIDAGKAAAIFWESTNQRVYSFTPTGRGGVIIMFKGVTYSGGGTVVTIRNAVNGSKVKIDTNLLNGRLIYIDTRPTNKSVLVMDNNQIITRRNDIIVNGTDWIKTEPNIENIIEFENPSGSISTGYILGYNNEVEGI